MLLWAKRRCASRGKLQNQYDGNGKLVAALSYNADGSTSITDALGNTTAFGYDGLKAPMKKSCEIVSGMTHALSRSVDSGPS